MDNHNDRLSAVRSFVIHNYGRQSFGQLKLHIMSIGRDMHVFVYCRILLRDWHITLRADS